MDWVIFTLFILGFKFLDDLGGLFSIVSQLIISVSLILFSWGWNIIFEELPSPEVITGLSLIIGVLHVIIHFLSRLIED